MRTAVVPLLCCLLGAFNVAEAQTIYTFTKIADTATHPAAGLAGVSCLSMNNQGSVAVRPAGGDVWLGNGQSFSQIAPSAAGICASINDLDEVAYLVSHPPTAVISLVKNSNGTLTTLARSDQSPFLWGSTYLPSLNASGHALFHGGLGASGIYIGPSGTPVYDPTPTFQPLTNTSAASMNESDVVVFRAQNTSGTLGIYRGSLTPLFEDFDTVSGGTVRFGLTRPVINNAGTVAFVGSLDGVHGIYTTDDGFSMTLVGTSPVDRISINDAGSVVYRRTLSGGAGSGIYIGQPGLINQPVIEQGQALDGSTVQDAFIWEESLNDEGQVAFWARLADGRWGVFRADPPLQVDVTANGSDGPVMLAPGEALAIDILFDAPGAGLPTANLAIGVVAPFGTLWLGPGGFGAAPAALYSGPLPDFGPVTLFDFPSTAGFPAGTYRWFMIVHEPGTGAVTIDFADAVVP